MIVGYARVSTEDQKLDLQIDALKHAGCTRIYEDHAQSGRYFNRKGLQDAINSLKPGATLVVWRLDRLGRSLSGLVHLIDQLSKREAHFKSITEIIDTSSPGGRFVFHLMAALSEFERAIISERTKAGLSAARSRGANLGRPRLLSDAQIIEAIETVCCGDANYFEVAQALGVSERTLRRYADRTINLGQLIRQNPIDNN